MKIVFDFVCDEAPLFSEVGVLLEKENHQVIGFTLGNRWKNVWKDKFKTHKLTLKKELSVDQELTRIAELYREENPASFSPADRFLNTKSRLLQKQFLVSHFILFEEMLEQEKPDIIITTGVAYMYNLVILSVCKKKGVKCISLYGTRQPKSMFTYSTSKGGNWDYLDRIYQQELIKINSDDYFEEQEYLVRFRDKIRKPDYMASARQKGGVKFVFVKEFMTRMENWYVNGWGGQEDDYITKHPLWYALRDVKRIALKKILPLLKLFDQANFNDKYILFPLHLQPEASTLILSNFYVDQLEVIRNISKVLPANVSLYVKEHPAAYGRHKIGFYKSLLDIHNVKLIAPDVDTQKMIIKSKGVVVLSGTMGWEAMLLGVPVYVLGNVFYDNFKNVIQVSGFQELGNAINTSFISDEKSILAALRSINKAAFEGIFDVCKLDAAERVLAYDNIIKVKQGIDRIFSIEISNEY
jgi:hypothetical protein